MENSVSPEIVGQIVGSIFSTMLNLEVQADDSPAAPVEDRITSSVFLEGDWNGAVSVECNRRQACQFAAQFLGSDPPEAVDDDVRDVLGELANMIGGNIKSLIPGQIRLSMPSVIDGHDYSVRVCGSSVEDKIGFRFDGGVFWITVRTGSSANGAASAVRKGDEQPQ
ncbi:MAG: chemotaxis protein CheX [Acidobacteriota bacterium]